MRSAVKAACAVVFTGALCFCAWGLAGALHEQGFIEAGISAFQQGRYDEAISHFTAAIEKNPTNPYTYNDRGLCYIEMGEYDRAIADFSKAIELKPDFAEAYYNRGIAHFKKGGYTNRTPFKDAIEDFTKAITLNPEYTDAYYNRGLAYNQHYNRGRNYDKNDTTDYHAKAIADFERVLSIDHNFALAYAGMGNAYYRNKEYEKAEEFFAKALEQEDWIIRKVGEKGLAGVYASRARNLKAMRDYNSSIFYYNKALELDPELFTAISHQASNYKLIGEYERAIELYDRAIALKKDDPTYKWLYHSYQGKGDCYYHLGEHDKALQMYEKAIEECRKKLPEREYRIYVSIGNVYLELGKPDKAIENFNLTVKMANKNDTYVADAYKGLGTAYKALGQSEKARELLEIARDMYERYGEAGQETEKKIEEIDRLLSEL